jgi:hypothetical protein
VPAHALRLETQLHTVSAFRAAVDRVSAAFLKPDNGGNDRCRLLIKYHGSHVAGLMQVGHGAINSEL